MPPLTDLDNRIAADPDWNASYNAALPGATAVATGVPLIHVTWLGLWLLLDEPLALAQLAAVTVAADAALWAAVMLTDWGAVLAAVMAVEVAASDTLVMGTDVAPTVAVATAVMGSVKVNPVAPPTAVPPAENVPGLVAIATVNYVPVAEFTVKFPLYPPGVMPVTVTVWPTT